MNTKSQLLLQKELNVDPSYITKIIKKDARYEQEKRI